MLRSCTTNIAIWRHVHKFLTILFTKLETVPQTVSIRRTFKLEKAQIPKITWNYMVGQPHPKPPLDPPLHYIALLLQLHECLKVTLERFAQNSVKRLYCTMHVYRKRHWGILLPYWSCNLPNTMREYVVTAPAVARTRHKRPKYWDGRRYWHSTSHGMWISSLLFQRCGCRWRRLQWRC